MKNKNHCHSFNKSICINLTFNTSTQRQGKLPNATTGGKYFKEYHAERGGDELCVSKTSIKQGNRVLVIDDLVATGGTLIAACDLLASMEATVKKFFYL